MKNCATMSITSVSYAFAGRQILHQMKYQYGGKSMVIEIDFNSDEAIYTQLMNQIIMGIATSRLQEGEYLPSVRQLAEAVGVNMHTVNKAYALLRQEGFVSIDRRKGTFVSIDVNKMKAMQEIKQDLMVAIARGHCKNVSREEVHQIIDEIYDEDGMD